MLPLDEFNYRIGRLQRPKHTYKLQCRQYGVPPHFQHPRCTELEDSGDTLNSIFCKFSTVCQKDILDIEINALTIDKVR
jgi:hypothetical protein